MMATCWDCGGEGTVWLEGGCYEARCFTCGGSGEIDEEDDYDPHDDDFFDYQRQYEPERAALLFDAGSVPVMYEPQPDRKP